VGRDYWSGLLDWLRERVEREGKIGARDLAILTATDDPEEVARLVWEAACAQGRA
jgi:predicted Rossmann-fold nucleotide-binding protein